MRRAGLLTLVLLLLPRVALAAMDFNGSNQWATAASALLTNEPATLCAWTWTDVTTGYLVIMNTQNDTGNSLWTLQKGLALGTAFKNNATDSQSGYASKGTYTTGTWTAVCGVFTSDTARSMYKDTTSAPGTDATTVSDGTPDVSSIAGTYTGAQLWNGQLAHLAVWAKVLTTAELAAFFSGVNPCRIAREALTMYLPLTEAGTPQRDWASLRSWAFQNTPTYTLGPRVLPCTRH